MGFSRLLAWEVYNFMSIEYAKVSFDDTNIINIKGYNDSGKSALKCALDVLFFNIKPSLQLRFIKDGCDYFRVVCHFDDGVIILRDKYINGQGLYEMYKDGRLVYSTKSGTELTKINDVPEVIKQYLGLIQSDDWNVNSRSCFEQQLLVQTKGSENSRALNEILRSEEIAKAGELLNTDKNKLNSMIATVSSELDVYKRQIAESNGLSGEMISALREHDKILSDAEERLSKIDSTKKMLENINAIKITPELKCIDTQQLQRLNKLRGILSEIKSVAIMPKVTCKVDAGALKLLSSIRTACESKRKIEASITPIVSKVDATQLKKLAEMRDMLNSVKLINAQIEDCDTKLMQTKASIEECQAKLASAGKKFVKCKTCGSYVSVDE